MSAGLVQRERVTGHAVRPLGRSVGWGPALRVAWRDLRTHLGRTVLAVLMLGLPVALASAVAVLAATTDLSTEESLPGLLGQGDGLITDQFVDGPVSQDVSGQRFYSEDEDGSSDVPRDALTATEVEALLPGADVLPVRAGDASIAPAGWQGDVDDLAYVQTLELDTREPVTVGMHLLLSGRLPQASGEVALTPGAARFAGVGLGDTVTTQPPLTDGLTPADLPTVDLDLDVVGIAVRQGSSPTDVHATVLPGVLGADTAVAQWLVSSDTPMGQAQLDALNARGLTVLSRELATDPRTSLPEPPSFGSASEASVYVVAVVLVILQIVLLATPSFAVSVRQQRANLALLAATGADARALRRVVLSAAVLVGALAAFAGLLIGVGAVTLGLVLGYPWVPAARGPVELPPLWLGAVVALAVVAALLAAWLPARTAARTDPVEALAGRRGTTRTPWRTAALGAVVLAAGGVLTWLSADGGGQALLLAVGLLLSTAGSLLLVPLLVAALEPVARWLPLPLRLAARDTSRAAGRSIAAVAAVAATAGGLMALTTWGLSEVQFARDTYEPSAPVDTTLVQYDSTGVDDTTDVSFLTGSLPAGFDVAAAPTFGASPDGQTLSTTTVSLPGCEDPVAAMESTDSSDCILSQTLVANSVIAAEDALAARGFVFSEDERAVLRRGGVLVFAEFAGAVRDGALTATPVTVVSQPDPPYDVDVSAGDPVMLPAVVHDGERPSGSAMVAAVMLPATADLMGETSGYEAIVDGPRALTTAEEELLRSASRVSSVYTERGYQLDPLGMGLLPVGLVVAALLAVAVGTLTASGLALVDARPTHAVLSDVGARGHTRRLAAGGTAFVIALTGGIAGVVMGVGPGVALARLSTSSVYDQSVLEVDDYGYLGGRTVSVDPTIVIAWPTVIGLVVVVPVLLGLLVAVCVRGYSRARS